MRKGVTRDLHTQADWLASEGFLAVPRPIIAFFRAHLGGAPISAIAMRDRVRQAVDTPSKACERCVRFRSRKQRFVENSSFRRQARRIEPAQQKRTRAARAFGQAIDQIAELRIRRRIGCSRRARTRRPPSSPPSPAR